jgi:hypothetical protein
MVLRYNGKKSLCRDQGFRAIPGMLQHRSAIDEIHVLFGQVIAHSLTNKFPQTRTVTGR